VTEKSKCKVWRCSSDRDSYDHKPAEITSVSFGKNDELERNTVGWSEFHRMLGIKDGIKMHW